MKNIERVFTIVGALVAFLLGGLQISEILFAPKPGRLEISYQYTDKQVFPIGLDADRNEGMSDRFPIGVTLTNLGEKSIKHLTPKILHVPSINVVGRGVELAEREVDRDFVPYPMTETILPRVDLHPGETVNLDKFIALSFDYSNDMIRITKQGETIVPLYVELVAENYSSIEIARCLGLSDAETLRSFGVEHWFFSKNTTEHRNGIDLPPDFRTTVKLVQSV